MELREKDYTLEQAVAEAQRRWRMIGGWARVGIGDRGPICEVGVTEPGTFVKHTRLGRGKTFRKAFESADRRLGRQTARRVREQRGFPAVELFPE